MMRVRPATLGSLVHVWLAVLAAPALRGHAAHGAESVTVSGGADASGHQYTWTVTNAGTSAIVEVRFPHYRASLFFAPDGWTTECTAQVGVGVKDEPGVCTARASAGTGGIATGRSAVFRMQIASGGAKRLAGRVSVRRADGSEMVVRGVELPTRESVGDRHTSLIALGVVFLVLLIVQIRRPRQERRKTA